MRSVALPARTVCRGRDRRQPGLRPDRPAARLKHPADRPARAGGHAILLCSESGLYDQSGRVPTSFVLGRLQPSSMSRSPTMAPTDVIEQVRAIAGRVAASYGLELFDVQFRREAGGMVLRIQIDRAGPAATAEDSV